MPSKINCPSTGHPDWKKLAKQIGPERAYVAFFRNGGEIPDVETARNHLITKPEGYQSPPPVKEPVPALNTPKPPEPIISSTVTDVPAPEATVPPQPKPEPALAPPAELVTTGTSERFEHDAPVIEGGPSLDFRTDERFSQLDPKQWSSVLKESAAAGTKGNASGNRAETRIAVALREPDGRVVLTGLVVPQKILKSAGGHAFGEPALQRMGDGVKSREVSTGGKTVASVEDVVSAGFKPIAVIHFEGDPTKIFQTFKDEDTFDKAWGSHEKTAGKQIQNPEDVTSTGQRTLLQTRDRMREVLDAMTSLGDDPKHDEERGKLFDEYSRLQLDEDRLDRIQGGRNRRGPANPQFRTREEEARAPTEADRTAQFQAIANRLRGMGAKVDVFAKEFFAQSATDTIQQEIDVLKQRAAASQFAPERDALNRAIAIREQRLQELSANHIAGVTFNPWHIAVSMDDVDHASMASLVTLMHEAAEQLTMSLNIVMKGNVLKAIDESMDEIRAQAMAASERTGVPLAKETSATDALAEMLGQKFAAAGVPDAPNLAAAVLRWVKDLYYRVVMAAQKAFGREPSHEITLNWMENQLRRTVYGDYDYRLGRILDRFVTQPMVEVARRFTGHSGTPGGLVDFLDPIQFKMRQPSVDPISSDAVKWNIQFQTQGEDPGKELEIPQPEADARIQAAALNETLDLANKLKQSVAADMDWEKFLRIFRVTEDPKIMLAELEKQFPGSAAAKISGERMTEVMNARSTLEARVLAERLQRIVLAETTKAQRQIKESGDVLIESARDINRLEADLRNASLHEDTLQTKIKDMVKDLVRAYNRGLGTAHTHGELAEAVRNAEDLLESDQIPDEYQRVFKAVLDGQVPVFNYIKAIAGLDLNLRDLTTTEVVKAINENAETNPELRQLSANKPLAVALAVLARENADQVDQVQLGWMRDMTQFHAIHDDLEAIKGATQDQLKDMLANMKERAKAKSLRDRINRSYLQKRRALQSASNRIKALGERTSVLDHAKPLIAAHVETLQKSGSSAPSDWFPVNGAVWSAMSLQQDGRWIRQTRTLQINPDGSYANGEQVRSDIAENNLYLTANKAKAGSKAYEEIKRQTLELAKLDVLRQYPAGWNGLLEQLTAPTADKAAAIGGSAAARIKQLMLRFQGIQFTNQEQVLADSKNWTHAFTDVAAAAGMKDHGAVIDQLYHPIAYFLGVNPGLDEGPAIRQATKDARARLTKEPAADFDAKFAKFLRLTKVSNERIMSIAEKEGAFVKDPRLKGDLRNAVARGWLTVMRRMDGATVQTIISDMEKSGWRLEYKETGEGANAKRAVVGATTFDSIDPANAKTPEDAKQYWDELGNDDAMRKILAPFFTPSIIQRWLEPFLNKPGQEIFRWGKQPISQMDVQDAWDGAKDDVLTFIDNLSTKVHLVPDKEGNDPKLQFRMSILKQLDSLFGMEAKMAHESGQVRSMFDPMGPKPHVMMDARVNDLLPPEHLKFQTFDPEASRQLLAHVAFHAAFGRNGERMVQTVNELISGLQTAKRDYESIASKYTTKQARIAAASAMKMDFNDLEVKARKYDDAIKLQRRLEGLFGANNPAGPFYDIRTGMEAVHTMAGEVVDNPKVGMLHLLSLAERPLAMRSLGPMTIKYSAKSFADFLKTGFGSFLQAFHLHLFHLSEDGRIAGSVLGNATRQQPWDVALADIGNRGRFQTSKTDRFLIKPLRWIRAVQKKGVGAGDTGEFPRMAPIPGLGILNSVVQMGAMANAQNSVGMLRELVQNGIKYFNTHREDFDNPSFRFTKAKQLGMWQADQGVLDWYRNKTVEYGLGNLEDIIRKEMPRAAKAERIFDRDDVVRMVMMTNNELAGTASINTTPEFIQNNPALRLFMPLLRWPIARIHQTNKGFLDAEGRWSYLQALKGIGTLALWNLPVGIAFTFMMDKYDEKLLHKKSNLRSVPAIAALPILGPPIALAESASETGGVPAAMMGFLERSARANNVYGLAWDAVAQTLTSPDPNSGRRAFSLDQRAIVMSQLLNVMQAFDNLANEHTATWADFWKPFVSSLGGNGVLQTADIANNLLGLDNQESRLVSRINAQNWLRAAGRELNMDLREGGGASTPTPLGVWSREMQLAAMANDRIGFLNAYNKAMDAARAAVGEDPRVPQDDREHEAQRRVLGSWRSRNPLEVFKFRPTEAQVNQLYSVMDDSGKQDVQDALNRFESFSELITPTHAESQLEAQVRRLDAPMRARRQASGLLFASPY